MKVSSLINLLEQFLETHGDLTVEIADPMNGNVYSGEFSVELFDGVCDIGVGGTLKNDQ